MDDFTGRERLVDKYVGEGRGEEAGKIIYELIVDYARMKKFAKAEALRERLMEVDPSALLEVIRAADVIEEAKSKSIDHGHMERWSALYSGLDTDEANALHFAMEEISYGPNETVFKQDDPDSRLLFVDQGELKMTFRQGSGEFLIRNIGPGELAGEDTFFSNTAFRTHSLTTLTGVKLNGITNDILPIWEKERPKILSKLKEYTGRTKSVHDELKRKGLDRRVHKRVNLASKAVFQVLAKEGAPAAKPIRVTLADISSGGLAFYLKITKQDTAIMLLGRQLVVKFVVPVGREPQEVTKKGVVVGVRNHGFGDSSVHIKFDKGMNEQVVELVDKTNKLKKKPVVVPNS